MTLSRHSVSVGLLALTLGLSSAAISEQDTGSERLLFGDLHLHSNLSMDAYIAGNRTVSPAEAFRFAKGEAVQSSSGQTLRLAQPLDFLSVTDHSENLGIYAAWDRAMPGIRTSRVAQRYQEVARLAPQLGLREAFMQVMSEGGPLGNLEEASRRRIWREALLEAESHNQPGVFTTLLGYEWTSMISGDNLHRVVLFRDDAQRVAETLPVLASDSPDPEFLWSQLAAYEALGGSVLAIAHNGNLSNGRMFAPERVDGSPFDSAYSAARRYWEPLYEVTQMKGDGETHPRLSPGDVFAAFERWDQYNVAFTAEKAPEMVRYEYARQALFDGLALRDRLGENPFEFGLIGSTDSHTGLATTREDQFFGKFGDSEPSAQRIFERMGQQFVENWRLGSSGLTAVWAADNSRASLFDALRARRAYATTGTRIRLKFAAQWRSEVSDIASGTFDQPITRMGGVLPTVDDSLGCMTFTIEAEQDPLASPLQRVQVVKGALRAGGVWHESIYDVVLANDLEAGAAQLFTDWCDADFDRHQDAVYYARVLEVPSRRWTDYDRERFKLELPEGAETTVQERAYSSPIWYYSARAPL